MVKSNTENMVMILSRYQTIWDCHYKDLKDITIDNIWPTLKIAAANADVVIMKEGTQFTVLKHKHMTDLSSNYHINLLTNIVFAR